MSLYCQGNLLSIYSMFIDVYIYTFNRRLIEQISIPVNFEFILRKIDTGW